MGLEQAIEDRIRLEFFRKMHEDILALANRRYTISATKVAFIAGLVGVGGLAKQFQYPDVRLISYLLIPVVALFWDLIFWEQNFALLRITTFIRWKRQEFGLEADWEEWLHGRERRHKSITRKGFLYLTGGIYLTTLLSAFYGFGNAYHLVANGQNMPPLWLFFSFSFVVIVFWVAMFGWDCKRRNDVLGFLEDSQPYLRVGDAKMTQTSDTERAADARPFNEQIKDWEAQLKSLHKSEGDDDWLRLLYSSYLQRFLSDNNRIWTTGQLMVPLSLAPFAVVATLATPVSIIKLFILMIPSVSLIWLWLVIAENHRAFQEKSEQWLSTIEGILEAEKPGGPKVSGTLVKPGMIRRVRWWLAEGIVIVWGLLFLVVIVSGRWVFL